MKSQENLELITVGQLVEELAEFEEEYSDYDVVCWTPNHEPCYINDVEPDEDGDLCASIQDNEVGSYNVATLIEVLGEYSDDTPVYVAGRGFYLNIDVKPDSTIFDEDCDEDSDIEVVACNGTIFGKYDEESEDED